MGSIYSQHTITYPIQWEDEYKRLGYIERWRQLFPEGSPEWKGSTRIGTLDLFPQYALMFLLETHYGIHSITWYELAATSHRSKNLTRRLNYWRIMREIMGETHFNLLQKRLHHNGFAWLRGEPDLFCWDLATHEWFFAEAKGKDTLKDKQLMWFRVCKEALGSSVDIRVYRLVPEHGK